SRTSSGPRMEKSRAAARRRPYHACQPLERPLTAGEKPFLRPCERSGRLGPERRQEETMTVATHIRITIAAVACAAIAAPAALGAGEPKTEQPSPGRGGAGVERQLGATTSADPAGEPKNQGPFPRNATGARSSSQAGAIRTPAGEPKNEAPFIR